MTSIPLKINLSAEEHLFITVLVNFLPPPLELKLNFLDGFKNFHERSGESKAKSLLKSVGGILQREVTEVDKVARLTEDRFAIVLPERNKRQSLGIAEEIRKKIESELGKIMAKGQKLTVSIGVSENPIDGSNADEIMEKAERLLKKAKSLGKNRVAV